MEETDGSSSRQKEYDTSFSLFMEACGLEVEEELSTFGHPKASKRSCRSSDVRDPLGFEVAALAHLDI